jgi:ABC-type microcin C transport system duplicated ATPase subunit YejF
MSIDADSLLDIRDLHVGFQSSRGVVRAVEGVSLRVPAARTVALVGESGCGKSATALSVLRLISATTGGQILFHDGGACADLLRLDGGALRRVRGNRIAMIFQEPMTALNPVYSIGEQIAEVVELHQGLRRRAAWAAAVEMLERVGILDVA